MSTALEDDQTATFAMMCCAHGAEKAVKEAIAHEGWRLAFSRPGFVTAKHDSGPPLPSNPFIRTASHSIGAVRGDDALVLIQQMSDLLQQSFPESHVFDQLHVWPKDRAAIGRFDFEPGIDEVSKLVAEQIHSKLHPRWVRNDSPNRIAEPGESVLDVVLVEPAHWFIGRHMADVWPTRWPGAVQPIEPEYEPISRAYYKAAEAIQWSGFEMRRGDVAIEIGSAPGGACGRLLELGLQVIGIDPAQMDERIANHPRFRHIRARAGDLPRREFRGAKWLLVDSNVKPDKTLVTVGNIVSHPHSQFRGLLLTMKLGDYNSVDQIDHWAEIILGWGAESVAVRQLARNRCEVCLAVTMAR
ncbi:MAG: SAM-dependent methyltransferase [Planctomycetota bacterium]